LDEAIKRHGGLESQRGGLFAACRLCTVGLVMHVQQIVVAPSRDVAQLDEPECVVSQCHTTLLMELGIQQTDHVPDEVMHAAVNCLEFAR